MNEKTHGKKLKLLGVFFIFSTLFLCFSQKNNIFNDFCCLFYQKTLLNTQNTAFGAGEQLKYKISYGRKNKKSGQLLAAYAHLSVEDTTYNNKPAYLLKAFGRSTRLFSLFMKVEHYYSSIIDAVNLNTLTYTIDITEGKYLNKTCFTFKTDSAYGQKNNDLLGAGYRLRTVNNSTIQTGDTLFFTYHYDNQIYQSHLIVLGKEVLKTRFGKINTLKLSPLLEKGRIFKSTTGAVIWVSYDNMQIPVKIELPIKVGSIYVKLDYYQNTLFDF